jgi:hypothetical protein
LAQQDEVTGEYRAGRGASIVRRRSEAGRSRFRPPTDHNHCARVLVPYVGGYVVLAAAIRHPGESRDPSSVGPGFRRDECVREAAKSARCKSVREGVVTS